MAIKFNGCGYCRNRGEVHDNNEIYRYCALSETPKNIGGFNYEELKISDYTSSPKIDQATLDKNCDDYGEGNAKVIFRVEDGKLINLANGEKRELPLSLRTKHKLVEE